MAVGATGNLFDPLPGPGAAAEEVKALLEQDGVRIERIVSTGQATPLGTWLEQPRGEWVVLLAGAASLRVAGDDTARPMGPGDYLYLPAGCRHRVEWTDPAGATVWLAVHLP